MATKFKRFLTVTLLIVFFSLSLNGQNHKFTQKLTWQSDKNAFYYEVEIRQLSNNKTQTYETESNFLELSLNAGDYQYKVYAYDFLGRPASESKWQNFTVTKAKTPVIEALPNNVAVSENEKINFEIPIDVSSITSETEVVLINKDTKQEIKGSLNIKTKNNEPVASDAVFPEVGEGVWEMKITNPSGLFVISEPVDVVKKVSEAVEMVVEHPETKRYDKKIVENYLDGKSQEQLKKELEEKLKKEAERKAEEARIAEEKRIAEEARLAEEKRKAEEARIAEEKRLAEEARIAEENRKAEEARIAEEKRKAEEARIAEEDRRREEQRIEDERRLAEIHREAEERRLAEKARLAEEHRLAEEERLEEKARLAEEKRAKRLAKNSKSAADFTVLAGAGALYDFYNSKIFDYNKVIFGTQNPVQQLLPSAVVRMQWLPLKNNTFKTGMELTCVQSLMQIENDYMNAELPVTMPELNLVLHTKLFTPKLHFAIKGGVSFFIVNEFITYKNNEVSREPSSLTFIEFSSQGGVSLYLIPSKHFVMELGCDYKSVSIISSSIKGINSYFVMGVRL